MDALYTILLIIIIIIVLVGQSGLNKKIEALEFKIIDLQSLLRKLNLPKPLVTETPKTVLREEEFAPKPVAEKEAVVPKPLPPIEKEVVEYHKEVISDSKSSIIHSSIKTSRTFQKEAQPKLSFLKGIPILKNLSARTW